MVKLIYCADGNRRFAEIALRHGFTYGAQLPNTVYYPPGFVDQDWRNPNRERYMSALAQHKPALATVLDWEKPEQLDEVLSWATEAAGYVTEAVIIIPKVMGGISQLPRTIGGKQVRLGYSVPTSFAGTQLPVWEFVGWSVHLLGGNPKKQLEIAAYLNVRSVDSNYAVLIGKFGKHWTYRREIKWKQRTEDGLYLAFELSCINIRAAWLGCKATVRYATEKDLPQIKRIADYYKSELGYVMWPSLREAAAKRELYVALYGESIVGFCNWHRRRDGWSTIYEIAVHRDFARQQIGRALLEAVPAPRRLKCTVDNERANGFYASSGMKLAQVEQGRKRPLNVWTFQS